MIIETNTGSTTFYNYGATPHETADGRKFYPALLDADNNPIKKKVKFPSTGLAAEDDGRTLGEIIDHQMKQCPAGTTRDEIRKDIVFGMRNKNSARYTKTLVNPTKLQSLKVVTQTVINWLVTTERATEAIPICNGTASESDVRTLHQEMVEEQRDAA